jgi:phenylacetate-CoA ligase
VKVQSLFVLLGEFLRLRHQQWLRPEKLQALQQNKLGKLIKHAYEQVPYYRRLFDSNRIKPEDIRTVRDLVHLPITTKALFQSLPLAEVTARDVDLNRCICSRTSGTLGIPLTLYYRKEDHDILDFVWARAKVANGQRLVDRVV